jgi:hypothetical protein
MNGSSIYFQLVRGRGLPPHLQKVELREAGLLTGDVGGARSRALSCGALRPMIWGGWGHGSSSCGRPESSGNNTWRRRRGAHPAVARANKVERGGAQEIAEQRCLGTRMAVHSPHFWSSGAPFVTRRPVGASPATQSAWAGRDIGPWMGSGPWVGRLGRLQC